MRGGEGRGEDGRPGKARGKGESVMDDTCAENKIIS